MSLEISAKPFPASALVVAVACLLGLSCAQTTWSGARDVRATDAKGANVNQAELQEDLQRFCGEFTSHVFEAMEPMQHAPQPEISQAALQQLLLYAASALDIATEPQPELGLLDMIVFVTLSRRTVDQYWVPQVYKEAGADLGRVMAQSEDEIWKIGGKILEQERREDLAELIADWQKQNPEQRRVEAVRFRAFSSAAGALAEQKAKKTRGILSNLKTATAVADEAVLVAERAIFMANRLPFLLRLQARVGTREMIGDTAQQLASVNGVLDHAEGLRPLVSDLSGLVERAATAAEETRRLVDSLRPLVSAPGDRAAAAKTGRAQSVPLEEMNALADKSLAIVQELRAMAPGGKSDVSARIDAVVRRWLVVLLLVGAAWAVMFWGGYYVFRRLAESHSDDRRPSARLSTNHHPEARHTPRELR